MKGYWKNFFQSDLFWIEFAEQYDLLWGQERDPITDKVVRLHSAADLQKYCMRYRGRPQEACLNVNVRGFTPSSRKIKERETRERKQASNVVVTTKATKTTKTTKTTEMAEMAVDNTIAVPKSIRQGSHTFALHHNIPHHEATRWLDDHEREWTIASSALQAQQRKVFETNRIALV